MTVGGNKIDYAGDVATPTAELITVKCLLNSVDSTAEAKFLAADAANFYLGTPLPNPCQDHPRMHYASVQLASART